MINKIILTNYRSYSKFEKTFSDGLNIIQGRNSTGKSTIVEAIGYALQGSGLQKGKGTSWIKRGQTEGQVSLYIDDYIITRGNKKQVVTDLEGNILARGHTGINEWVYKTYGLLPDLYKTSFHVAQKEISAFAALGPVEKTKRVEKLLKLDVIDNIKKNAQAERRVILGNLALLQQQKEQLGNMDPKELEKLKEDKDLMEKNIEETKKLQAIQNDKLAVYNMELQAYSKKVSLIKRLIDKSASAEENKKSIEQMEKNILENTKIIEETKLYAEKCNLEKKLHNVIIKEKYFTSDIKEIMDLRNILLKSEEAKNELEQKFKNFKPNQDLKVTPKMAQELFHKQNKLLDKIDELEKMPTICPTCGQDMPDMTDKLTELKKELKQVENKYTEIRDNLNYRTLVTELYKGKETIEEIDIMLDSLRLKNDYLRLKELADVSKPSKAPVNIDYLKSKLIDLKADQSIHLRLLEYADVKAPKPIGEVKDYDKELKEMYDTFNNLSSKITTIENMMAQVEKLTKGIEDKEEEKDLIEGFIKFIANYREAFSSKIIPMLEENANKIINYLSEGKLKSLNLDNNYTIGGYDLYSGSEEDAANFALRLAIAQISRLGKYNTIILDEIAASYDSVREDKLLEVLKSTNMQIIYISHGDINY